MIESDHCSAEFFVVSLVQGTKPKVGKLILQGAVFPVTAAAAPIPTLTVLYDHFSV